MFLGLDIPVLCLTSPYQYSALLALSSYHAFQYSIRSPLSEQTCSFQFWFENKKLRREDGWLVGWLVDSVEL